MVRIERLCLVASLILAVSILGGCNNADNVPEKTTPVTPSEIEGNELIVGMHQNTTITAGSDFTVAIKNDGMVVATGNNDEGQCDVSNWEKIVSLAAGENHTVGLKKDGTVIATGNNEYKQCDVESWENIISISAGGNHTIGLRGDGTVIATGMNISGQCNVTEWTNITAISAGETHTVGMRNDGTVVAVGPNLYGECDVAKWVNIVAVSAGSYCTVGLVEDGTVLSVGENEMRNDEVSNWSNIVAIAAGYPIIGLKEDGTSEVFGTYSEKLKDSDLIKYTAYNVSDWNHIVAVAAGYTHVAGLTDFGTVISMGTNSSGECNTSDWSDIALSSGEIAPIVIEPDSSNTDPSEINSELGEEVAYKDIKITITSIDKVSGPEYTTLKAGEEFVVVSVTMKNNGNSDFYYTSSDFVLQNSKGDYSGFATTKANEDTRLKSGNIAPASTVTGTIAFRAPQNDPGLVLRYCDNSFGDGAIYIKLN